MDIIRHYFPGLSASQQEKFARLEPLYREWNQKINVISRKDIDNLYPHHILHALGIAKIIRFTPGTQVLDLGTGGGIPGIPLAIFFPESHFTLVDSIGKKIKVVEGIREELGLENVTARHTRAEELHQVFDFVVCRAVASLPQLVAWSLPLIGQRQKNAIPNGLITLKGGRLDEEVKALPRKSYVEIYPLSDFFHEEYYLEKFAVYVQK